MIGLVYVSSTNSLYGVMSHEKANSSLTTEHFRIFFEWEALWVSKFVARRGAGLLTGRSMLRGQTVNFFLGSWP
jgi:hypothetical protein